MKRNRNAFTLTELMLVCAIIGVLAALLFAAMGPVRERSRRAVCASNLQQQGHAIAMYRADYDGIDPSVGSTLTVARMGLPINPTVMEDTYLKNKSVLICPDFSMTKDRDFQRDYYHYFYVDSAHFMPLVEQRGMESVTMDCEAHNRPFDYPNEPRWTTRHVIFLRLNGQVVSREIPLGDLDYAKW